MKCVLNGIPLKKCDRKMPDAPRVKKTHMAKMTCPAITHSTPCRKFMKFKDLPRKAFGTKDYKYTLACQEKISGITALQYSALEKVDTGTGRPSYLIRYPVIQLDVPKWGNKATPWSKDPKTWWALRSTGHTGRSGCHYICRACGGSAISVDLFKKYNGVRTPLGYPKDSPAPQCAYNDGKKDNYYDYRTNVWKRYEAAKKMSYPMKGCTCQSN